MAETVFYIEDPNGVVQQFSGTPYEPPTHKVIAVDEQTVIITDPDVMGKEKEASSFSWFLHGCSLFTMLCCCWCACFSSCFGFIGLLCSVASYTDHKNGSYDGYKYKKTCAAVWMSLGLIFGVGTIGGVAYLVYSQKDILLGLQTQLTDQIAQLQDLTAALG